MDITYIPMAKGWVYLTVVLDWSSRKVLAWRLSISMDVDFCIEAVEEAIARWGKPEIFNTDQGSQFTRQDQKGRGRGLHAGCKCRAVAAYLGAELAEVTVGGHQSTVPPVFWPLIIGGEGRARNRVEAWLMVRGSPDPSGASRQRLAIKSQSDPKSKKPRTFVRGFAYFGSSTWARTRDLRINSPALYRLSYRGICRFSC